MVLMMMIMELAVVVITNVKRGNALSQWRLVSPASPHARFSFFAGKTKKYKAMAMAGTRTRWKKRASKIIISTLVLPSNG